MMQDSLRSTIKRRLPRVLLLLYRMWQQRDFRDTISAFRFLATPTLMASLPARLRLLPRIYEPNSGMECAHTQDEMLQFTRAILDVPSDVPGCVVEAGCFKGGSTAKFSVAAKLSHRQLFVFDSFEGLPENTEPHKLTIFGEQTDFSRGQYRGSLEQVQRNVLTYGDADVCVYVKGWFDQTMPQFSQPIIAAYIDVDLVSSTRTCLKYLYPLLQPGAYLFSQDAHLPLIIQLLEDSEFWEKEIGCPKPTIAGLGKKKLIRIRKPLS